MLESAPLDAESFPFTRLPPDVQYNVAQSLCAHCGNEDDPMAILYHDPEDATQALMNLCLVSREMRSLAQGILYHFPRVYSYTDFFRTLHARPDLADNVKVQQCIYGDEMGRRPDENGESHHREDIWYLRSLAIELKLDDTDLVTFGKSYIDYPEGRDDDIHGTGYYEMRIDFDNLGSALTMALCPRLEFLAMELDDARLERRGMERFRNPAKFKYLPGLAKKKPDCLPLVHTLVLRNIWHQDPNTLGIDRMSFLWNLLPNVKRLILFKATVDIETFGYLNIDPSEYDLLSEYSWKVLPHLKELRFLRFGRGDLEIPFPAIKRLVAKCSELEKFVFSPVLLDDNAYPPSRVLDSIVSASATLRHLTINCPISEASYVDAKHLIGSELQQFTALESLILDQAVFCHHHHNPTSTKDPDCLTDILPPDLRRLTLNIHAKFAAINDIIVLGEAISYGEFPRLVYLRIQMTFEDEHWPEADPPATPREWESVPTRAPLTGRPAEVNEPLLEPRRMRKKLITDAFDKTNVRLEIDFFRRRRFVYTVNGDMAPSIGGITADARLIDEVE